METAIGAKAKASIAGLLLTIVAGAAGSLIGVFTLGNGTYDVAPFKVRFALKPNFSGVTRVAIEALPGISPGSAKATTHATPLEADATIVGVSDAGVADTLIKCVTSGTIAGGGCAIDVTNPHSVGNYIGEHNRSAMVKYGIKVGVLTLGGGLLGGLVTSMGRWKRILVGVVAGAVVIGGLGAVTKLTYDMGKFSGTTFSSTTTK